MGRLKVGDMWGHSLLPRLTRNHSLIPIHELLTPERIAVSGTNVSLGNQDPAGTAGLQLCPTFPGFQSQGAQAGTELPVLPHPKESRSMPFPKGNVGHRMYWTLDTIQALLPSTFSPSDPSRAGIIHQKEAEAAAEIPGSLREPWPSASCLSLLPDPLHQHL